MQKCTNPIQTCANHDCQKDHIIFLAESLQQCRWCGVPTKVMERKYPAIQLRLHHTPSKWNADISRCKKKSFNKKGHSSADINKKLNRLEELAQDVFKSFEVQELIPEKQECKDELNKQDGKDAGIKPTKVLLLPK